MTDHLTDRIPDVARGRDAWSVVDEAHLASCGDCRREWRVVAAVEPVEAQLDLERITAGVLAGLERPRVLAMPRRRLWPLGLAAAAAVALAVTTFGRGSPAADERAVAIGSDAAPTLFPELDRLVESELEVVLAAVTPAEPAVESSPLGDLPRLGDLTDDELEQLLDAVEG